MKHDVLEASSASVQNSALH